MCLPYILIFIQVKLLQRANRDATQYNSMQINPKLEANKEFYHYFTGMTHWLLSVVGISAELEMLWVLPGVLHSWLLVCLTGLQSREKIMPQGVEEAVADLQPAFSRCS